MDEVHTIEEALRQREILAKAKGMPPDPQLFKAIF